MFPSQSNLLTPHCGEGSATRISRHKFRHLAIFAPVWYVAQFIPTAYLINIDERASHIGFLSVRLVPCILLSKSDKHIKVQMHSCLREKKNFIYYDIQVRSSRPLRHESRRKFTARWKNKNSSIQHVDLLYLVTCIGKCSSIQRQYIIQFKSINNTQWDSTNKTLRFFRLSAAQNSIYFGKY